MALNKIILMGRMTKDAELRHTQNNKAVASFTIACDREGKDKVTDFIDCVAWEQSAEFVSKYLGKGRNIAVEGRLQIREWTDQNSNKRRNAEVKVDRVYFADSKKSDDEPGYQYSKMQPQFVDVDDDRPLPL